MDNEVTVALPVDVSLLVAGIIIAAFGAWLLNRESAVMKLFGLIPFLGGVYVFLRSFEVIGHQGALFVCMVALTAAGASMIDRRGKKTGQSLIGLGILAIGILALIDSGLALLPQIDLGGNLTAVFSSGWEVLKDILSRADSGLDDVNR